MKNLSYEQSLKRLRLPTLAFRRVRGDMIKTYKIMRGLYDQQLTLDNGLELEDTTSHNLRKSRQKLKKRFCIKNIKIHSFSHKIVNLWNNFPSAAVEAKTLNSFKNRLYYH